MIIETFVKKPIITQAVLLTEDNIDEVLKWVNSIQPHNKQAEKGYKPTGIDETLWPCVGIFVPTKEGKMLCFIGDYMIKEPFPTDDRMFYPCKPDMHLLTYDKI